MADARTTVRLSPKLIDTLDGLVDDGYYMSRSQAVRSLVRDGLESNDLARPGAGRRPREHD